LIGQSCTLCWDYLLSFELDLMKQDAPALRPSQSESSASTFITRPKAGESLR